MTSSKEKTSKSKTLVIAILCVIAILIVVGFFGFRDGGWFRGNGGSREAGNVMSLSEYARELEKSGNSEAAAAVYELIAEFGDGELIRKANEEIPVVKGNNEIEQFERFLSGGESK